MAGYLDHGQSQMQKQISTVIEFGGANSETAVWRFIDHGFEIRPRPTCNRCNGVAFFKSR